MPSAVDWGDWVHIAGSFDDQLEPADVGIKNADLMDLMIQRKGGPIGTSGRAGFALRVDHGTIAFQEHLGPLLKKYGLTATMAVYSKQREVNARYNSTPWPIVDSWFASHGISFANHSDDHRDKPDAAGWHGGTIGSADALADFLPSSPVESYMPHGSAEYERYGGFNRANTHEAIFDTPAGRMALSKHALISGYRGGRYRPIYGRPMQGLTHWSIEKSTPDVFRKAVRMAISDRMGLAVMFHPEFIGSRGRMTWADVDECLAYVAQKRDEGLLVPLTVEGLALADMRSAYRDDLHRDPALARPRLWLTEGFLTNEGRFESSTPGALASFALGLGAKKWALGGARVAEWHIHAASASNVTVSVTDADGTWMAERTVALDIGDHVVPNPFGIPLDHTGNLITKLVLNSGSIKISESHLYAN